MAGLRDIYEYQLLDCEGNLYKQGLARDLAKELGVEQNNIYTAWKRNNKLLGMYSVERVQVKEPKKDCSEYLEKYEEALNQLEYLDKTFTYRRNHFTKEQWDEFIVKQLEKKKGENDE